MRDPLCTRFAQAGKFLEKYGQLELFPVKLQVPLLMTVHIVMLSKCVLLRGFR